MPDSAQNVKWNYRQRPHTLWRVGGNGEVEGNVNACFFIDWLDAGLITSHTYLATTTPGDCIDALFDAGP